MKLANVGASVLARAVLVDVDMYAFAYASGARAWTLAAYIERFGDYQ